MPGVCAAAVKRPNRTAAGAIANLAAQGIPFIALIVSTPILLRALGREPYGALVLFNLIPQIAGQLDLGLSTAATRGFAQYSAHGDHAGARRVFHETLVLLIVWGLLLCLLFHLGHDVVAQALKLGETVGDDSPAWVAAALGIPLAMANAAALVPLRALERYGSAARIQVFGGTAYWLVCTTWAANGGGIADLVALSTANIALTTVALLVVGKRPSSMRTRGSDPKAASLDPRVVRPIVERQSADRDRRLLLRAFLPVGAGAFVAQVSSLATFNADKLLVSALVSPAAAGAYTICTGLANKTLLVIASAATFTFPRATQLHAAGDADSLLETYCATARLCATLAMAMLVPILGLAHAFLALWLDEAFADRYAIVLRLLAIGYALAAASVVAANVTMGLGRARIAALFAFLGGVLTIGSLVVLTPRFGIVGAAVASLIGMSQTVVFNTLVSREIGPAARRTAWPLLLRLAAVGGPVALALAAAAPLLHSWSALVSAAVAAAAVFPALWLLTFGHDHEWLLVKRVGQARPGPAS